MANLLEATVQQIPRFSLLSCLHIALLGTDIQMCHNKSLNLILERFYRDLKNTRLKDIERLSFVLGLYDFETESGIEKDLCVEFLKELKCRVPEITRHPRCFVSCLHYLTLKGFYDIELISSVLDDKFLKMAYNNNDNLGREVFCLDSFAQINLPSYSGNRLSDKKRRTMGKLLSHYIPTRNGKFKLSTTDRMLLEIMEATELNYKFCHVTHVLPHYDRPGTYHINVLFL